MVERAITTGDAVLVRSHPDWGRGQVIRVIPSPLGEQAFVEFQSGRLEKLPVAELAPQPSLAAELAQAGPEAAAAFDLRMFAAAMKAEHIRTGALSSARLAPLPHQILLADKILSRGLDSHLIADDVGLGKTVEAGMIYQAFAQR